MRAHKIRSKTSQILHICRYQMRIFFRQTSLIKILAFFIYLLMVLIVGIIFALIFLGVLVQDSDFQPPIAYRDLLSFVFLTLFVTPITYMILSGITGFRNPYINDRQDTHLFQRIQVDSSVMYFSTKAINFLKVIPMTCLISFFLFEPLMFVLNLPWWRIFMVMMVITLIFILSGKIADLLFVVFSKIRYKRRWMRIWMDSNYTIQGIATLLIPSISLLLLNLFIVPSFESLSNYFYLPYINSAAAATGFFFRSGVPRESWLGFLSLVLETIGLVIVTNFIMGRYKPNKDINESQTVLAFQVTSIYELAGVKSLEVSDLVSEDLKGRTTFSNKSPVRACLLKDWLAIKRIRNLRKHLYQAPIIIIALSILFLFFMPENNQYFYSILVAALYPIADFSLQISKLEGKKPMMQFAVRKRHLIISKIIIILVGSLAYSIPLFIAKGAFVIPVIIFIAGVGAVTGITKFGLSRMSNFIPIFAIFLILPILIFF